MPLEHLGFAIHISCDGQEIPQFGTEVVSEKQMSCWIPSEAGNDFQVHCVDIRGNMDKIADVYCDGRFMEGRAASAGKNQVITGVQTSTTEMTALTFSNVLTHDDDAASLPNNVDIANLGVIEVRIFHAKLEHEDSPPIVRKVHEIGAVSELSKKGGLHQVSLGKSKAVPAQNSARWVIDGSEKEPYASFLFRHRSAGILQAMGIMPRSSLSEEPAGPPSASTRKRTKNPSATDRSRGKRCRIMPASGSEVEDDVKPSIIDEEDNSRIKLLQENLKKIQDELITLTAKSSSTRIKAERAPSPIHVGDAAGEIIDLTED